MQTQAMPQRDTATIYLEYLDPASNQLLRCPLEEFPFVIGRNDSCQLTVDSGRVSREHAEIVRVGTGYVIRDLESTNGTSVNGEKIRENSLTDGDTVSIADFDFDFHAPAGGQSRQTVTVAMDDRSSSREEVTPVALVEALRSLSHWSGLGRIPTPGLTIQSLDGSEAIGKWYPSLRHTLRGTPENQVLELAPRLEQRLRQLHQVSVMYNALEQPVLDRRLLLEISSQDLDNTHLLESVGWMRSKFGPSVELVLGCDAEAWQQHYRNNQMCEALLDMGIQIAVLGVSQFRPPIVCEALEKASMVVISASAIDASQRSPAVATNIEEFIREFVSSNCMAIAQLGRTRPEQDVLRQMGFQATAVSGSD